MHLCKPRRVPNTTSVGSRAFGARTADCTSRCHTASPVAAMVEVWRCVLSLHPPMHVVPQPGEEEERRERFRERTDATAARLAEVGQRADKVKK